MHSVISEGAASKPARPIPATAEQEPPRGEAVSPWGEGAKRLRGRIAQKKSAAIAALWVTGILLGDARNISMLFELSRLLGPLAACRGARSSGATVNVAH